MTDAEGGGQDFPCTQCGAKLHYDAGVLAMVCPYCGHKETIPTGGGAAFGQQQGYGPQAGHAGVREVPIEEGFRLAQRGLGVQVATIQCGDCGATVNVGQGERTTKCAFCGSAKVLSQETNQQAIRPESLVPFQITKEAANGKFGQWLSSLWFRPNDLKRMAKVQEMGGVYVPFWTFDAHVDSQWSADRGWYYYETETYTSYENGRSVTRTRQVQRVRWESAWGRRQDFHDDTLVCAGKGLPVELVDTFVTFNTKQLVPYQPAFLAGWRAEAYALDLMPAWGQGQQKMANAQQTRCAGDVGGDTHRNLNVQNTFYQVTFKHVLLPIWIAAYRYNGKVYRFLVNGQTGEVVGKAPWSVWKITAAVVTVLAILAVIAVVLHNQDAKRKAATPPAFDAPAAEAPVMTKPTSSPVMAKPTAPSLNPPSTPTGKPTAPTMTRPAAGAATTTGPGTKPATSATPASSAMAKPAASAKPAGSATPAPSASAKK